MLSALRRRLGTRWALFPLVAILGGYWLLPISGQVVVIPGSQAPALLWPQIQADPFSPGASQSMVVHVTDVVPWGNVLLTINDRPAQLDNVAEHPGGTWTWRWVFSPRSHSDTLEATLAFYHDCDGGCLERGRLVVSSRGPRAPTPASIPANGQPTKLGVVFASPERDWHGRSGWDVELTYAKVTDDEPQWGIHDLATRVASATAKGLRVLVRVDYERGQSLPPAGDLRALDDYLRYLRRLARDNRLRGVYGYVVGSGFNSLDSNSLSPVQPVTPAWYARVFNGYGVPAIRDDNVVQTIRAENRYARVMVGPVRPWSVDQNGETRSKVDVPWLNYMASLVAALDDAARAKADAGIPLSAPDGFAVQAPGRPSAPELAGLNGAEEPRRDLHRPEWGEAQAGFRVYRDWLSIVDSYPTTRGLPLFITSSNTFISGDGAPPAQNYPPGWLSAALQEIDQEPRVLALVWFLDGPLSDTQWDEFSLSRRTGRLNEAAREFDALLLGGQ